jgi:hypothetical protein
MTNSDLIERIAVGFDLLFENDVDLFDLGTRGVSEETITFRLGLYLQSLFPGHHVDCEYNRMWDQVKKCDLLGIASMEPDVLIHRRQSDESNLFCLEAKKQYLWTHAEKGYDRMQRKLEALTHPKAEYRYRLGLAWRIAESQDRTVHGATWFLNGEPKPEIGLSGFQAQLLDWMQ